MKHMATLLIGYDVERQVQKYWHETRHFLKKVVPLHEEFDIPCTLFVCGRTLENNRKYFKTVKTHPLFDIQQHTYSHVLLKTVCMENLDGKITVFESGSLEEIEREVIKTRNLIEEYFEKPCIGLTAPYGYYRGFCDRPDILRILRRANVRFTRSWARDEHDYQPVPWKIQPFWYKPQGFGDILEFPIQGWQDYYWRERHGWKDIQGYITYLKECVELVKKKNLTWTYCTHDWTS